MGSINRINARLDAKSAEQISFLREQTRLTVSEIVKRAIDAYARAVREAQPDAYALMRRAGFIGCGDGPETLAEDAKQEFARAMQQKHDHR